MSFLSELATRSLENPARPLTDSSLLELFGGRPTSAGVNVTPEKAMRLGAALRGVQIIASSGAGCPLKVYRHSDRSEVRTSVLSTDRLDTPMEKWETAIAHLAGWGSAVLFKKRDGRGMIRSLVPIHPSRVAVERVKTKDPDRPLARKFRVDGEGETDDYDILYIPFLSLDGITGIGPIGYARETFGTALASEQVAGKMFAQGLLLDGILTTDKTVSRKQARDLKKRWRAMTQGIDHAHDVAVLDQGAKFEPITMPAKDAQFIEQRKFSRSEIAGLLGLPGWMLNDQEKSTSWGTGMEQQFNTFVMLTLKPYLQRIEQRLNAEVLPTGSHYAEFKLEGLLRGDSKSRAAFYASGIQHGWLVPNDVRPLENLNPVPWGDEPYLPYNQAADGQPPSTDDEESSDDNQD